MAKSKRYIEDLDPYSGCVDVDRIGMNPLAIGFLQRGQRFETGAVSPKLLERLFDFCDPRWTVCKTPRPRVCPLCGKRINVEVGEDEIALGSAEIRVLADEDIYAAPDLIYHFIDEHEYAPPKAFVNAVLKSKAGAVEHRALVKALQ